MKSLSGCFAHGCSEVDKAAELLSPSMTPVSEPSRWLHCVREGKRDVSPSELIGTRGCSTSIPSHQLQRRTKSYEEEKKVSEQNLRAIDPLRRLMHL